MYSLDVLIFSGFIDLLYISVYLFVFCTACTVYFVLYDAMHCAYSEEVSTTLELIVFDQILQTDREQAEQAPAERERSADLQEEEGEEDGEEEEKVIDNEVPPDVFERDTEPETDRRHKKPRTD